MGLLLFDVAGVHFDDQEQTVVHQVAASRQKLSVSLELSEDLVAIFVPEEHELASFLHTHDI